MFALSKEETKGTLQTDGLMEHWHCSSGACLAIMTHEFYLCTESYLVTSKVVV